MYKSRRFFYADEDYMENGKNAQTMIQEIMDDPQLPGLEEIVIGCWGKVWTDNGGAQPLIDGIVANKDKFSHIKSLFIGDMDFEECEVSWIVQADYSRLWEAVPQLEKLVIKGSSGLELGTIRHEHLRHFEIICGGLPTEIIHSIQKAELPALETLLLYFGVKDFGFDGGISTIREMLAQSNFPKLTYLGLTDSEIEDEIVQAVLECRYIDQITTLDLSMGSLTDKGGQMLLDRLPGHSNIKNLKLEYHFLSNEMMKRLEKLAGIQVNVHDQQEADTDTFGSRTYYYAMLTE